MLKVPENGLIALNVPLDRLRLGALSTRTTHPFYIARWNEMLAALGIAGRIENPYWDKTKGEMVAGCVNPSLLAKLAPSSLSCSSPSKGRWTKQPQGHCGFCLPCLIRRASLLAERPDRVYACESQRWPPRHEAGRRSADPLVSDGDRASGRPSRSRQGADP